ncbi:MAG: family 10 glycosylhydrolase [Defluviitaleaceae bacterium]|nr:family 10 glycosylhydrolase [Defluviitaleaceae bacterium]
MSKKTLLSVVAVIAVIAVFVVLNSSSGYVAVAALDYHYGNTEETQEIEEETEEAEDFIIYEESAPAIFEGFRATDEDFRGVWVTTVINLDFPTTPALSNEEIRREINYIVDTSAAMGLNAIILQVRPAGDAIYPSNIFPWSKYLTGEQGLAPADGFDPLAYWLYRTHGAGMELHAWINPYRVTHTTSNIRDVNLLYPTSPARLNPHLVVPFARGSNYALYLDPGFPESRQIIIDGIIELLTNYDLDGIHFDDYFYPGRYFNDSVSFAMHGYGMSHREWRLNNVNTLIYEVRQTINYINPNVRFGISPTGIWANDNIEPRGSATRGYQHYIELAADSLHWIREGWVDYIIPQIYWHIGFEIADYYTLLRWWENALYGSDVALHIGHAAWREYEGHMGWRPPGELLRQLQLNYQSDIVRGSVFFRWWHLRDHVADTLYNWYAERPLPENEWLTSPLRYTAN